MHLLFPRHSAIFAACSVIFFSLAAEALDSNLDIEKFPSPSIIFKIPCASSVPLAGTKKSIRTHLPTTQGYMHKHAPLSKPTDG